jgi:uncharacterized membrane protein YbhN (UPF0104 family)
MIRGFLVVLFLAARLVNGEVIKQTVRSIGYTISRKDAFFLTMLRTYASLLIPRAGFGAAGIFLKKKYGVNYAEYGALLLPISVMQCLVIGLLGLGCLAVLALQFNQEFPPLIAGAFVASAVLGGAALFFHVTVPEKWSGKIAQFIRRLSTAWRQLSRDKTLLGRLIGLQLLLMILRAARLQVAFWSLGVSANFFGVLIASLLADLMFFVSVTPNAIGFREMAIVFGAQVSDVSTSVWLVVALLDRVVVTATVIVAAQFGLWKMPELQSEEAKETQTPLSNS